MRDIKSTRRPRSPTTLLGLASAGIVLVLVGALAAVPFLARQEERPLRSYMLAGFETAAQIETAGDGSFVLELSFSDAGVPADPPPLSVAVSMVGHEMPPEGVQLSRTGIGSYRAEGRLEMPGRWQVTVSTDAAAFDIIVDHRVSF